MVKGLESFRSWFADYEDQYAIIGGTACDILMAQAEVNFRATKDIDLVLIVEALSADFGRHFWQYIKAAGYEHCNKSTDKLQFYRFYKPKAAGFPTMIELFSTKPEALVLPDDAVLTPLSFSEAISSLSAILLDKEYYDFLCAGKIIIDGISVLDCIYLIPFKAKAWLDLSERKQNGETVDSKDIRKHANDILRLASILMPGQSVELPPAIKNVMDITIARLENSEINTKQIGIVGMDKYKLLDVLKRAYK